MSDNILYAIVELYKIFPEGIQLSLLHVRNLKEVSLIGVAKKNGIIGVVDHLEASPWFQNVSLKYQNKLEREEGLEFQIDCELEGI